MIKKMLVISLFLALAVVSTPSFSQASKGSITIGSQLIETVNKNAIEKVRIFSSVKALVDGKDIKILSNNLFSIKDGDDVIYVNIDTISMYTLNKKVLDIYIL